MTPKPLATALLALPVLCSSPASAEDGAPQLYGRLNTGVESVRLHAPGAEDRASVWRLSNYRSVLGVRGSEDLGGGLHAIFQVEGTLSPDTGAGSIAARDTRLGLQGPWGTLFGGNWTTPYNAATAALDPFYPTTAGYMSIMGNGSAPTTDNVIDTTSFDRRQQNSIHYWTPVWHGLSLRLARGLNEEKPASGARPALTSSALVYEQGKLYATLAWEGHHDYQGPGLDDRGLKAGAAWQIGRTRVAAVAERLRYGTAAGVLARSAYYVSASRQMGAHGLRLGIARAADGSGPAGVRLGSLQAGPDSGAWHATLGYDYALSKRSSLFVFHSRLRNDRRAVVDFAINRLDAPAGARLDATSLGLRHAF